MKAEKDPSAGRLRRVLTLPELVAYGLGTTIGAGIYVLIGKVAGLAGEQGIYAFLLACVAVVLPAMAYAEFVGRQPHAAGSARYVAHGTRLPWLGTVAGLAVALAGMISSAALSLGAAGYLSRWVALPEAVMAPAVILLLAAVAFAGIRESVWLAGLVTLLETGALVAVVVAGVVEMPAEVGARLIVPPPLEPAQATAVLAATMLAFFAFIGFEDMVSVAEEAVSPERTVARAILITLALTLLIYLGVYATALAVVPAGVLSASPAPLALVAERLAWLPGDAVGAVAVVAVVNGVLVQIVMASRVLYGLARMGQLPAFLARVHPRRRTPDLAIGLVAAVIIMLALAFPVTALADATSRIVMGMYALVCLSLLLVKRRGEPLPAGAFRAPAWAVAGGMIICLGLLVAA
jgi:amino acid transporter